MEKAGSTPMSKYLGQVIAIEADQRKTSMRQVTDAYHGLEKQVLLEGLVGTYEPRFEDGEQLPPEGTRVQATVEQMIAATREALVSLFDVTAARDFTNSTTAARADVVVGDLVLVEKAPVPYILWLERQVDHLESFANRIPTLPASTEWSLAEARGVYASTPVETSRTVQQHKVLTLAPATDKHPAQVNVVPEAVVVGTWKRIKYSGAVPVARKEEILRRIATLRKALHSAREQIKRVEVEEPQVGAKVLAYLFDPTA